MLAMPAPSLSETRDNAAFDALLWELSRPGLPRQLPDPGEGVIVGALLDRECSVYSTDPLLMPEIMRTGAELADIQHADHVFLGTLATPDPLDHAQSAQVNVTTPAHCVNGHSALHSA